VGMRLEVLVDHPDGLAREEAARQETIPVRRGNGEISAAVNDPRDDSLTIPIVVGLLGGRVASSARVFQLDGDATRAQEGPAILPGTRRHGPQQYQTHHGHAAERLHPASPLFPSSLAWTTHGIVRHFARVHT